MLARTLKREARRGVRPCKASWPRNGRSGASCAARTSRGHVLPLLCRVQRRATARGTGSGRSARPPARRRGGGLGAVLFALAALLLSPAFVPAAAAQSPVEVEVWSGEVRMGTETFSAAGITSVFTGFNEGDYGSLDDKTFTFDGETDTQSYTIDVAAIVVVTNSGGDVTHDNFSISLTSPLSDEARSILKLHVEGRTDPFAFSDADYDSDLHTYIWPDHGLSWSSGDRIALRLTRPPYRRPVITYGNWYGGVDHRWLYENPANDTRNYEKAVRLSPVRASDPDGEPLRYSLEGRDADLFRIDPKTGEILTRPDVVYDYENEERSCDYPGKPSISPCYDVTVRVTDGSGESASRRMTVELLDREDRQVLQNLRLWAPAGTNDELRVGWNDPGEDDRPASYQVHWNTVEPAGPDPNGVHRHRWRGKWVAGDRTSARIDEAPWSYARLEPDTLYRVRVRRYYGPVDSHAQPTSDGALRTLSHWSRTLVKGTGSAGGPVARSAEVLSDGRTVELFFDEAIDASRLPDADDVFAVRVNGVAVGVESTIGTAADASRIRLSLDVERPVRSGHAVEVAYTAPAGGSTVRALRNAGGAAAASFTVRARNYAALSASDPGVGPAPVSAVVNSAGNLVSVTFDEPMDDNFNNTSIVTLTVDGAPVGLIGANRHPSNRNVIAIVPTPPTTIKAGQTVTVSYTDPNPGSDDTSNVIQDTDGNDAASFTDFPVTNNSTVRALSVRDVTVTEGTDASADFVVTLAPASTDTVTVAYATADGTADEGDDYTATSGTLTFAPGVTEQTVSVPIIDDAVEDSGETFTFTLSSPSGAALGRAVATGTILNIEIVPTVTGVELVADASGDRRWTPGETIEARLTFSEAVTVSGGSPWVEVSIDGFAHNGFLGYASGSGSETLVFSTQVPAGTEGFTGLAVVANSLVAGGASIVSGTGVAAELGHDGTEPTAAPGTGGPDTGTTEAFKVKLKDVPAEHDGSTPVVFEVEFTKNPEGYSYRTMRDSTLVIRQGGQSLNATKARRLNRPHNDRWEVTITPVSKADLAVSIGPFSTCTETGAVCAANDEVLANEVSKTIQGPPGLSVADARVDEDSGDPVVFAVTLGRASKHTVTVDYATSDGTGSNAAVAGEDYTETSGTLTFAAGVTEQTVSVPVLDDSHDEGEETFTLTLSNPQGGNAWLRDATATGTIVNTDAMPRAWLARFGRTVAEQVIGAVEGRFSSGRTAGAEMTLAGERIGLSGPGSGSGAGAAPEDDDAREAAAADAEARSRLEAMTTWLRGDSGQGPGSSSGAGGEDGTRAGFKSRTVTGRDLLTGSSFALTAEANAGGTVSLWGRGAVSRFDGREGDLSLDGEVVSAMMGADWVRERWTAGVLVSRSVGEGGYRGPTAEGEVESTLTGLFPYGRYEASERVTLWGVAGYGTGDLVLTPKGQSAMRTDMELAMGAVGLRGVAVEAPAAGGVELTVKTDALAVRTTSGKTEGLEAAEADVTRVRLGLEGTWLGIEAGGGTLSPRLEVGVRHDGGDAETGLGLDLGGGLAWSHPAAGLSAELSGRGLLTHESRGLRDRGLSGSFAWEPGQGSGRGPSLTLTQTVGASASGGMDALLGRGTMAGLAANDDGSGAGGSGADDDLANRRLELRMGYGFSAFGDRFTSTPELGLGLSNGQRQYTLGWRLDLVQGGTGALELGLEATRREATGANDDAPAEHGVRLGLRARF